MCVCVRACLPAFVLPAWYLNTCALGGPHGWPSTAEAQLSPLLVPYPYHAAGRTVELSYCGTDSLHIRCLDLGV